VACSVQVAVARVFTSCNIGLNFYNGWLLHAAKKKGNGLNLQLGRPPVHCFHSTLPAVVGRAVSPVGVSPAEVPSGPSAIAEGALLAFPAASSGRRVPQQLVYSVAGAQLLRSKCSHAWALAAAAVSA